MLHRLFQVWAAKQILGIVGTMKFLAHQDDRSPLCSSCQECHETCKHVAHCPKVGRSATFLQSTQGVEQWLKHNNTHPDLQSLLLKFLQGRGTLTCLECSLALNLPHILQDFAELQDVNVWDNFAVGMVSIKLLRIQCSHLIKSNLSSHATRWISIAMTSDCYTEWPMECSKGKE
jgi:hypothetical protein